VSRFICNYLVTKLTREFLGGGADFWVAHASRVLVSASRRNRLSFESRRSGSMQTPKKVRDREDALAPAGAGRDACATQAATGIVDPGYN